MLRKVRKITLSSEFSLIPVIRNELLGLFIYKTSQKIHKKISNLY